RCQLAPTCVPLPPCRKFEFNPKQGIDNPVLSLLERPRFCLLSKEEGRSFGFHLRQDLGKAVPVVCRVEPGTSAQRQGLREGDRILGVNDHVVECEDYAVVRLGLLCLPHCCRP
uniref:PDZ domain-containing protein n=1 Tax=Lynx canadensis TaxID=61383 RepID=A0A667IB83_LYNCA